MDEEATGVGMNGVGDDTTKSASLSLSVGAVLSDEYKEKKKKLIKQRIVKQAWKRWGKYAVTQDTPIEDLLREARERGGFVPKDDSKSTSMEIDESNENADVENRMEFTTPEANGVSFGIVPARRKLIKSSLLNIDDDEKLDDAFNKCVSAIGTHAKPNATYQTENESTGITEFSHELCFNVPMGGVNHVDAVVGAINEQGDIGNAPIVCSSNVYYRLRNEKDSYMVHLQMYVPCIQQQGGVNFVHENDSADVEVPVHATVTSGSDNRRSNVDIEVDNWHIQFQLPSTFESPTSKFMDELNFLDIALPHDISAIQHSALYGQTELFPISHMEDHRNVDSTMRYLLCCDTSDRALKCDLIAVNEIFAGHNEHLGENKILEGMQVVGKESLCSTHARCVLACLHGEMAEDELAKKGDFYVVDCVVPVASEGQIWFDDHNAEKAIVWPVPEKKMKRMEISSKSKALGGSICLDPLGITSVSL